MKNLSNVDSNHEVSTMLQHGDPLKPHTSL